MSKTLTIATDINAADTLTRMTGQGSVTAPSLVVPAGVSRIRGIYAAITGDGGAAGFCTALLRIGGNAVQNGEQAIVIGGIGIVAIQAGADAAAITAPLFKLMDADIEVNPSDNITISGEQMGTDVGDMHLAVTLVFE